MKEKILFSGIQPTGEPHLGNYLGALQNWVKLQNEYSAIYSIVSFHALTIDIKPQELKDNSFKLAIDLLSLGIDPKKCILFRQSDVTEHAELAWILNCLTPVAELERMTQYKDKIAQDKKAANAGLFTYPVLQAADILLYHAEYVPVGEDQLQHLELSRIIARKFNKRYGDYFPEVKPVLSQTVRVMSLNDPMKKMSKSLGPKSYIALRDKPEVIKKKIASAVTDSLGNTTTLGGGHNLLMLFKEFAPAKEFQKYEQEYKLRSLSYAKLKQDLTERIITFLRPIQEKQAHYEKHPDEVYRILEKGSSQARLRAQKTLKEVRTIVGLD